MPPAYDGTGSLCSFATGLSGRKQAAMVVGCKSTLERRSGYAELMRQLQTTSCEQCGPSWSRSFSTNSPCTIRQKDQVATECALQLVVELDWMDVDALAVRAKGDHVSQSSDPRGALGLVQSLFVCMTVKVCPAIVTLPVLSFFPGGAAALYATAPLPVPLALDVTVIQLSWLLAVHAQPLAVDTATVPVPAPDIDTLVGLIE